MFCIPHQAPYCRLNVTVNGSINQLAIYIAMGVHPVDWISRDSRRMQICYVPSIRIQGSILQLSTSRVRQGCDSSALQVDPPSSPPPLSSIRHHFSDSHSGIIVLIAAPIPYILFNPNLPYNRLLLWLYIVSLSAFQAIEIKPHDLLLIRSFSALPQLSPSSRVKTPLGLPIFALHCVALPTVS